MRRLGPVAAVIASLLLPAAAGAQLTLGARAGYGLAWGDVGGTLGMGDWVNGQVPLQLDALYRVNPRLALGLYFSYGFGFPGGEAADLCDGPGADCTATVTRFGVQGTWALPPRGRLVPWVGANIGYEWNRLEFSDPTETTETTFQGWEYLGLQGGLDFSLGERLAAGPFLAAALARYGEGDISGAGGRSIDDKSLHGWLTFGLRGRFDL